MNQLETAIDLRKVELVTEEIAKINREATVKAEVAREIDDFVTALNQQHPSGRLDAGNLSAISELTRFLVPTTGSVRKARAAPPRLPW
jgi:hypothetical protein